MTSQEQKHSLNVNKAPKQSYILSENDGTGQQWTTKFRKNREFKMIEELGKEIRSRISAVTPAIKFLGDL